MSEELNNQADPEKAVPAEKPGSAAATKPAEEAETQHVESVDSTPFDNELQKEKTLAHVDLENKLAFKGDDSDGKIEWGLRTVRCQQY